MERGYLHFVIRELTALLDTGRYDDISVDAVTEAIERSPGILDWIRDNIPDANLEGVLHEPDKSEYEQLVRDLSGQHRSKPGRKWGVSNRGLCLLLAWTNTLAEQAGGRPPSAPLQPQ